MILLAIDPGSTESGWLAYAADLQVVSRHGIALNETLLEDIRDEIWMAGIDRVVIEWTAPRGMPASAQLFETMWWAGRFTEAASPVPVDRINRFDVKRHLCGTTAANDSNVRAALVDRFGGVGGKAVAIGVKANPGPLYGVKDDVWAALGVAVTYADNLKDAAA